MECGSGSCQNIEGGGQRCHCPVQYNGPHCEHYRCSHYCNNHGLCYIDVATAKVNCHCRPEWTGERCEAPVNLCENRCYNGGTCYKTSHGIPTCHCRPGITGLRCEKCANLTCLNNGYCSKEYGHDVCICPGGYKGKHCETKICGKFLAEGEI